MGSNEQYDHRWVNKVTEQTEVRPFREVATDGRSNKTPTVQREEELKDELKVRREAIQEILEQNQEAAYVRT
jgi:hypothetical protein